MTHGVAATKGHVAGNGGLRGHSCGEVFPFVIYAQGTFDDLWYWVLQPNGLRIGPFKEWTKAEGLAKRLKMFGQLDPDAPETQDIIQRETVQQHTYYRDHNSSLHDGWRWRIAAGAGPDSRAEYTCDKGRLWESSAYTNREIRQSMDQFVSTGSDPQWQER